MKIMEIIRIRISTDNVETIHCEIIEQLAAYQQTHREPKIKVYRHETIHNDLCICLSYFRTSNCQVPLLGEHLAACMKLFGETYLSCWIEHDSSNRLNESLY